jgi:tRNA nucleotidyltransferase/poly(A) polymerase
MKKTLHIQINHPEEILLLRRKFLDAGHQLFLVGGCVRDSILGRVPKDWDLATDATPEQMMQFLSDLHIIPVGESFGVIRVLVGEHEFEIAAFREDVGEGRRPDSVRFADIKTDVLRRDFTINALFFDLETAQIVDLVGGFEDLQTGTLRTVGNPTDRFREDPLRKLRAVRFATRFRMKIDEETELSIQSDPSLKGVSPERIRDEFLKALRSTEEKETVIEMIVRLRLKTEIFKEMRLCHTESLSDTDPIVFIAAVLQSNRLEDIEKFLRRLTFTTIEIRDIKFLIQMFRNEFLLHPFRMKRAQRTEDHLILQFALITHMNPATVTKFLDFELTVTGEHLMAEGFKPGPEMGQEIERREDQIFRMI